MDSPQIFPYACYNSPEFAVILKNFQQLRDANFSHKHACEQIEINKI